ncbi:hypothetical protein BGZ96_012170 [Linnemannia gamsii]|uniref:Uncharacterized protein n=1 Tax=Linnemannia gamsii TaxID=64522 RepID=A0ABQ7KCG5_9FUNG|nr:hypothetical protein BGZ96_012170 [Linnemannia gamsii]
MTRLSTCIALALALTSSTLVMAQNPIVASTPDNMPPVKCVIATPQQHLTQGQPTEIEFQNCQGSGDVQLLYGKNVAKLTVYKTLACSKVQFTPTEGKKSVTCSFTPDHAGVFSLSTRDGSGEATYSGPFTVDPVEPASAAAGDKTGKSETTSPHASGDEVIAPGASAPQINKLPSSAVPKTEELGEAPMGSTKQKGTAGSVIAKRALYDMMGFLVM